MCLHILGTAAMRFATTTAWSASSTAGTTEWPVRTGAIPTVMDIATDAGEFRCRGEQARRDIPRLQRRATAFRVTPELRRVKALQPQVGMSAEDKSWAGNATVVQERKAATALVADSPCGRGTTVVT